MDGSPPCQPSMGPNPRCGSSRTHSLPLSLHYGSLSYTLSFRLYLLSALLSAVFRHHWALALLSRLFVSFSPVVVHCLRLLLLSGCIAASPSPPAWPGCLGTISCLAPFVHSLARSDLVHRHHRPPSPSFSSRCPLTHALSPGMKTQFAV